MWNKLLLAMVAVTMLCGIAYAEPDLICVKFDGQKYICHPSSLEAYQQSVQRNEENVWYCQSAQPIGAFAQAGVFGTHDTLAEIEAAIIAVDPSLENSLLKGKVKWFTDK